MLCLILYFKFLQLTNFTGIIFNYWKKKSWSQENACVRARCLFPPPSLSLPPYLPTFLPTYLSTYLSMYLAFQFLWISIWVHTELKNRRLPPPSIIKMNKGKLTTLDYFRIQNCIFITIILPHKFRFVSNFLDWAGVSISGRLYCLLLLISFSYPRNNVHYSGKFDVDIQKQNKKRNKNKNKTYNITELDKNN